MHLGWEEWLTVPLQGMAGCWRAIRGAVPPALCATCADLPLPTLAPQSTTMLPTHQPRAPASM